MTKRRHIKHALSTYVSPKKFDTAITGTTPINTSSND